MEKPNDLEVLAQAIEALRSQLRKRSLSHEGRRIVLEIVEKLAEMRESFQEKILLARKLFRMLVQTLYRLFSQALMIILNAR